MWYIKRVGYILLAAYSLPAIVISFLIYMWGIPLTLALKIGFSWVTWPWILKWI